jgi:hypothetical protein
MIRRFRQKWFEEVIKCTLWEVKLLEAVSE